MPNSKFTDEMVEIISARSKRKTSAVLNIAHDLTSEQIEAFCNGIRAIIKAHPQTRKDGYHVYFDGVSEISLVILITFYTAATSKHQDLRIKHEINLDIWRLAEKMGIKFAFPIHDTHIFLHDSKGPTLTPSPSRENLEKIAASFAPKGHAVVPPGPRVGEAYFAERSL
jgi:MscS family membrane protein